MATADELRLMAKIARLYYERGLSQLQIAGQLDISQATVSRLLKRALDEKIVQISVTLPPGFNGLLMRVSCKSSGESATRRPSCMPTV
ncbi:MAG: sigma factor-like helix-turn-helix DNA-binding protein [Aggregatilineales bacterium]